MPNDTKNRGVILGQRNTDWQAGALKGIDFLKIKTSPPFTPFFFVILTTSFFAGLADFTLPMDFVKPF